MENTERVCIYFFTASGSTSPFCLLRYRKNVFMCGADGGLICIRFIFCFNFLFLVWYAWKWYYISTAGCFFFHNVHVRRSPMISVTMSIYIKYNACGYWFIPFYWTICVHRVCECLLSERRSKKESNINEKRCTTSTTRIPSTLQYIDKFRRMPVVWLREHLSDVLYDGIVLYTRHQMTHRHTLILWS